MPPSQHRPPRFHYRGWNSHPSDGREPLNDVIGFFVGDRTCVGEPCDIRFDRSNRDRFSGEEIKTAKSGLPS